MNRQEMIEKLESYRQENGTYDVPAINRDERADDDSLDTTFASYFGDGDADHASSDSPLVALARDLNQEMAQQKAADAEVEINELADQLGNATGSERNRMYHRLEELGAGRWTGDAESLQFEWFQVPGSQYGDQVDLEEGAGLPSGDVSWGGPRPGAGRKPRGDGRTSRILRVAATDEELESIKQSTTPDSRRDILLSHDDRPAYMWTDDRVVQVQWMNELAASIAENLGEGTAEELVEYALSAEGRTSWGIEIPDWFDAQDRGKLIDMVADNLRDDEAD